MSNIELPKIEMPKHCPQVVVSICHLNNRGSIDIQYQTIVDDTHLRGCLADVESILTFEATKAIRQRVFWYHTEHYSNDAQ